MGHFRAFVFLLCILSLPVGCREPSSRESFVKSSEKDDCGRYHFRMDMKDSLSVYSIGFFTRIDNCSRESLKDLAVDVLAVSPSGREYVERVFLCKEAFVSARSITNDIDVPYRTGFRPVEPGVWDLFLTVPEEDSVGGFRGMGICLSKNSASISAADECKNN